MPKFYSVCGRKCYFALTFGKLFFSQESLKGEGIIHTRKTVWLYFSNKQNDLLAEVRIMQYSKSWGWILFPVKWSMKRGNLCLHSVQWECIHIQTIAQLPANRSQSALWTSRAAFKERGSTIWTKWLATSFLLIHHLQTLSQDWRQQVSNIAQTPVSADLPSPVSWRK